MLKTIYDIRNDVLVKLNQSTTYAFYSETILNDWIDEAHLWASAAHKWPFTEGRSSTTWVSGTEEYTYPEGWKSDSIRYMMLGTKRLTKLNFADYQQFREDQSSSDERVYSDFGNLYYINPNVDSSGTITAYGQYVPAEFDWTDNTAVTVFSNREEEGNTAIMEEVLSYAYTREKRFDVAQFHHQRAIELLEGIWQRHKDEQFGYQTKNRGMFKSFDILRGSRDNEDIKRNQWY